MPWRTCPASASTCRTTSRSTSSTPARSRSRMQPAATQRWRRPFIGAQWLFLRSGPGRDEPLRGRRLRAQQRRCGVPEPHVPLPAARDPLRRERRGGGPRLPGPRRADVLGRARVGDDHEHGPAVHPALRFNYLSTDQDRREWVEAVRVAGDILGQPAMAPFNGGETSPGRRGRDGRGDPRVGRARRRDGAPSVVHRADGGRRAVRRRSADDARPRPRRAAGRGRFGRCPTSPTATSTPR